MSSYEFPRARALLDPPGPTDGAIATSLLGLAAIAVLLVRAARKIVCSDDPRD